jgi:hypothetical protein
MHFGMAFLPSLDIGAGCGGPVVDEVAATIIGRSVERCPFAIVTTVCEIENLEFLRNAAKILNYPEMVDVLLRAPHSSDSVLSGFERTHQGDYQTTG